VAAKTGTAEKDGRIPPVSEVAYIQKYLKNINPKLSWDEVEAEMIRLMTAAPEQYTTQDRAVDQAVINLSQDIAIDTIRARIAANKSEYDNFAWVVAMAPAEDPEIAVAVLLFQGGTSLYAAPIVREIIGEYLQLDKEYMDFSLGTAIQ